jgi:glycosyltransferase involved in cell wall biosynthesis
MLAASLALLPDLPWTLSIVGDGPARAAVEGLFAGFAPHRLRWHGLVAPAGIAALLPHAALYVWPGCGEAYGLAYLEAQAAGLPVIACHTAGVPEVVTHGLTGLLTPEGDVAAYAEAIATLLRDPAHRSKLAQNARTKTLQDHALGPAATTLEKIMQAALTRRP